MAKTQRCKEIVARTPVVLAASESYQRDPTHLQFCGAPAVKNERCARHLARPNTKLARMWSRFVRRAHVA